MAARPRSDLHSKRWGAVAVDADLFSAVALRGALAGPDTIVNLATHNPPSSRMFLPGAWRKNDHIRRAASGTLVAVAIAVGAHRFIQESFALTYPDSGDRWIDESTPIQPARYNRSVADAEAATKRFSQAGGASVVLRFAAFYGADSIHTRDLIGFIRRGWAPIPGSADSYFSSVSHDDAASAVIAALDAPAGIYNVVDDEPMTHREFFGSLAQVLGVPPPKLPPAWMTPLLGSLGETLARSLRVSNRKLRAKTGWAPKYPSVREGWQAVVGALHSMPSAES